MIGSKWISGFFALVMLAGVEQATGGTVAVFFDDFDGGQSLVSGVSANWSGITTTTSVQGYAGYGTNGNVFGGVMLRNDSGGTGDMWGPPGVVSPQVTSLTLTGLPDHDSIDLNFLLAIIDSWDGLSEAHEGGKFSPDIFNVSIDGQLVFSEGFSERLFADTYDPPEGGCLVFFTQLGFSQSYDGAGHRDSAYDMGLDSILSNIPHSSSTLRVDWFASGSGYEGGPAESWAIENVAVRFRDSTSPVPEPASLVLWSGLGIMGLIAVRRRKEER